MGPLKERLSELGDAVRRATDDESTEKIVQGARARFLLTIQKRPSKSLRLLRVAPWMAAACLLAFGLLVWRWNAPRPLTVTLETQKAELTGAWIRAQNETKQLEFSDGSSVSLHPRTELRVDQTTERGATVTLGAGRALARIEPTKGAKWKFLAGPFSVRVTGTEFDLAWFPEQGVLELALHHGSVELSGPSFDEARTVRQGEFVRADLSDDEKVDARTKEESAQAKEESTGPEDDTSEDLPPEASSPEEKSSSSPTSTWRVQLASGDRKGALSSIEDAGSDQIFETATASELWAISDAARVGGHPSLARDALLALRAKHGSRGHSAYLLGKVYADQLHHPKKAIRWFETYLTEAPGDALSEQALGRLVELQVGTRRGVQAARRYLELYPNGSHANFARSSLR